MQGVLMPTSVMNCSARDCDDDEETAVTEWEMSLAERRDGSMSRSLTKVWAILPVAGLLEVDEYRC